MNSSAVLILVSCLLLQLAGAGGKDLYWQPNSNWGTPSNWALGRVPDCRDAATFNLVPDNSVIYLDVDATVQSISLPSNGQLVLAPSITIHLSPEEDCTVLGDTQPMAAAVENDFVGATTNYWECASNWITEDNFPAEHPPCGEDRAIFDEGAFSFVKASKSIFVRSLNVRGTDLESKSDLSSSEFSFGNLEIISACGAMPELCPCPPEGACPKPTGGPGVVTSDGTELPSVVVVGETKGSNVGWIVGGVVIGIVVISVLLILAVILYRRLRKKPVMGYYKDDLIDEPGLGSASAASDPEKLYDNPLFDEEQVKVDLGASVGLADVPEDDKGNGLTSYEVNPPPEDDKGNGLTSYPPLYAGNAEDEKFAPKLNKYERF